MQRQRGENILALMQAAIVSAVLILGGQGAAFLHGASTATDQMVICTADGAATVYVDAQGQPTRAPHHCPDCLPVLVAIAVGDVLIAGPVQSPDRHTRPMAEQSAPAVFAALYPARGPPVFRDVPT
jgi:hypothetical protein